MQTRTKEHNKVTRISSASTCRLCRIAASDDGHREIQDNILGESSSFLWVPGLGAFVEGYSLVISKEHVSCTACLDPERIEELEVVVESVRTVLNRIYGKGTIVFEHGTMGNDQHSSGCIEHHHLHILPADLSCVPTKLLLSNSSTLHPIDSMKTLSRFCQEKTPYLYFQTASSYQVAIEASILPSRQYLRQVVAVELGHEDAWDWRSRPCLENIERFVQRVGMMLKKDRRSR